MRCMDGQYRPAFFNLPNASNVTKCGAGRTLFFVKWKTSVQKKRKAKNCQPTANGSNEGKLCAYVGVPSS